MLTVSWTTPSPAGPWLLTSLVCSFATAPSLSFRFWFHPSAATSAQLAGCSFIALLRHSRVSNVVTVQLPIHVPNVTNKTQRWTGEITDNRATHRSFRYHVSLHFFSADDNLFHFSLSLSLPPPQFIAVLLSSQPHGQICPDKLSLWVKDFADTGFRLLQTCLAGKNECVGGILPPISGDRNKSQDLCGRRVDWLFAFPQ